jgi:hypothetical protein
MNKLTYGIFSIIAVVLISSQALADRVPLRCDIQKGGKVKSKACGNFETMDGTKLCKGKMTGTVKKPGNTCLFKGGTWQIGKYEINCAQPTNVAAGTFTPTQICTDGIHVVDVPQSTQTIGPAKDTCAAKTNGVYNDANCTTANVVGTDDIAYCWTSTKRDGANRLVCVQDDDANNDGNPNDPVAGYCETVATNKQVGGVYIFPKATRKTYTGTWWVRYTKSNRRKPILCNGGIQTLTP